MLHLIDIAIHRINHLHCSEKLILQGMNLSEKDFLSCSTSKLRSLGLGNARAGESYNPGQTLEAARRDLVWLERDGSLCIPVWSSMYPPLLRQLYDPPYMLFIRLSENSRRFICSGELFHSPFIAVVGTRRPSAVAQLYTLELCRDLAAAGFIIVSGIARGIDAMAHQAAVESRRPTIAVLGHGPDSLYPRSNYKLASQMLSCSGYLLSEYPPGTEPRPFRFPQRNRIIAGLCAGVLVMEAPHKSGALITADFALEQGREVMVAAQLLDSRLNGGGRALKECGAPGVHNLSDIVDLLSPDLLYPG